MSKKLFWLAIAAMVSLTSAAQAQVDVFFSTSNTDANAGSIIDLSNVGESASLFVWVNNNDIGVMDGLSLDILSSNASIVEGTAHIIDNPSNRWTATDEGTLGDLVDDSNAFALVGFGANGLTNDNSPVFHSEIQFDATELGTTQLSFAEGNNTISIAGAAPQSVNFGTATINVSSVPEPNSIVLGLGVLGLSMIRRKRTS